MLNIAPIKLLKGTHPDTGSTGLGCFMNVVAYLNGEPQITDQSECVCVTVRPIAIWLNDYMTDAERVQLLPYIERAMGSATHDQKELSRRAWACAHYAQRRAAWAKNAASAASAAWAKNAAASAESAESAVWAASAAWAEAESAKNAAKFDRGAFRRDLIADTLKLLDDLLPPATELQQIHIDRAEKLIALAQG